MKTYFEGISKVKYERGSNDPMTFRYYNPSEKIGDKTMEEHLRFAVAYWHTFG
ncbi:MAG: xylose isomerase, partial [Athalassotoga sp.]